MKQRFEVRRGPVRLLSFLQEQLRPAPSGRALKRALESNICRVNGKVERFASALLDAGDEVEIVPVFERARQPLKVLWEDEWIQLVDKPAGWVCEEGRFSHSLVHRLDKETSGVLFLAKREVERFQALFREGQIEKEYWAIVDGELTGEGEEISRFVRKGVFQGQTIWGSSSGPGLLAHTKWRSLKVGHRATLVAATPITGRTHQIRVHLAERSHPILVDRQYASRYRSTCFAPRPLLHARRLAFTHPVTHTRVEVIAPLPADFLRCLAEVGLSEI